MRWPGPGSTVSRTNRDLLVNVLRHPAFIAGDTDTAFFDTHGWRRCPRRWPAPTRCGYSALAAALADAAHNRSTATVFVAIPSGWRNLASGFQVKTIPRPRRQRTPRASTDSTATG